MRYVGEPLALVVAESAAIAEDALDHIDVDIEPLAAVADRDTARTDRNILFDATGTNLAITVTAIRGERTLHSRMRPTHGASTSRCNGMQPYRWSPVDF